MIIRPPRPWHIPESRLTSKSDWLNRRQLIRALGLGTIGLAAGCQTSGSAVPESYPYRLPVFKRNPRYTLDRPLTDEQVAATHNNFYEITSDKSAVWRQASTMVTRPWTIEVTGEVHQPRVWDLDDLLGAMPIEERTYRFRCVEAWAMAVPWIGFPLSALLDSARPTSHARYVRLVTRESTEMFPATATQDWYPWPYREGLAMSEAMHDLTLLAVGIYGHPLPNQHGAPIRLVVPWKYGYKSIKSIARIEVVRSEPATFWNDLVPEEYSFLGNVRPDIPHRRWSQATEQLIPSGRRVPTRMYNGYADLVAGLYSS